MKSVQLTNAKRLAPRFALVALLSASACNDSASSAAAAPEVAARADVVMQTKKAQTFADLCDVAPEKTAPKAFTWPQLTAPAAAGGSGYRWVNVWATWCKPCIEELPMLTRVFGDWKKQGQSVQLTLLSVDADAAAAQKFIADHAGTPATLQVGDPSQVSTWLTSLGLASGSSIPVHMLVDAQNNLVCARAGGISEQDLERFRRAMFP